MKLQEYISQMNLLKLPYHFGIEESPIYRIPDRNKPLFHLFTMGCGE
jgi:hypothetical protein